MLIFLHGFQVPTDGCSCASGGQVLLEPLLCFSATCKFLLGFCVDVSIVCISFCACAAGLWKHPVGTWINGFCELWLVLSFPWASMTADICSTRGYGKLTGWSVLACCRYCAVIWPGACRCQEDSVSALAPGSPCVWAKLVCSVGSAGSFGGGAEGVEHCSCSINITDRLKSRD